ncbi:MAG: hypothetical protein GTO14_10545, partial [Anaerolineales bacterium]|nr:hypothetical protein [Anaerolineales bacterium]
MVNNRRVVFLVALTVLALSFSACTVDRFRVGSMQTDVKTIEVGNAETVRAEIRMGVGEIEISGGADELMEAGFTYNVDELEPQVSYEVSGSTGRLVVEHRDVEGLPIGDYDDVRSEWVLRFNEDIPIDLRLTMGAAKGDIDLVGFNLTSLDFELGAGEGDLWLGNSPIRSMDLQMGAGDFTLDMTAGWEQDLNAEITGGVGKLTIYLPSDVGVVVDVTMGIAAVETRGMSKNGDTYTNDAYGESDV